MHICACLCSTLWLPQKAEITCTATWALSFSREASQAPAQRGICFGLLLGADPAAADARRGAEVILQEFG